MKGDFLTLALPSGRMMEETLEFLQQNEFKFQNKPSNRELTFFDDENRIKFYIVRNQDVPLVVLHGGADAGICGRDIILEHNYNLSIPLALPFGYCRLSLAVPESINEKEFFNKIHIRVVTKYPNLSRNYFYQKGINVEIIKLHGSIEVGPLLGISDCIVDLVSTGRTLRENGLKEIDKIIESQALLVVNPSSFYTRNKILLKLIHIFKNKKLKTK